MLRSSRVKLQPSIANPTQPFTLSMCLMREAKKAGISWWTSCATFACRAHGCGDADIGWKMVPLNNRTNDAFTAHPGAQLGAILAQSAKTPLWVLRRDMLQQGRVGNVVLAMAASKWQTSYAGTAALGIASPGARLPTEAAILEADEGAMQTAPRVSVECEAGQVVRAEKWEQRHVGVGNLLRATRPLRAHGHSTIAVCKGLEHMPPRPHATRATSESCRCRAFSKVADSLLIRLPSLGSFGGFGWSWPKSHKNRQHRMTLVKVGANSHQSNLRATCQQVACNFGFVGLTNFAP